MLAVIAASRGHNVIVSDIIALMTGVQSGALAPGFPQVPDPGEKKIARHQILADQFDLY